MIRLGKHLGLVTVAGKSVIRCAVCGKAVPPDHTPGVVTVNGPTC